MLSTWYYAWCCMIFSLRKMFLSSAATLCSSLFFIICHTLCMALNVYEFLKLKKKSKIIHMNCLLEFRKMTFTIHFIFTFLNISTTFHYVLFMFWYDRSQKSLFFHIKHMVLHLMFDEFLSPHNTFLACTVISCSSQLFSILYEFIDVKYHFKYFPHELLF